MTLKLTITDTSGRSSSRTKVISDRLDPYFFVTNDYNCENGNASITVVANTDNYTGSQWSIFKCDEYGNIDGSALEIGFHPHTYTFNNLEGNRYYHISHGVWESGCSTWSGAKKIYSTRLISSFDETIDIEEIGYYNITVDAHKDPSFYEHEWTLYESDANGTLCSQVGGFQTGGAAAFHYLNYGSDKYYLIRHRVKSSCNTWTESRRLVCVPNWCTSIAKSAYVPVSNQSVEEDLHEYKLYPNPASNIINVHYNSEIGNVMICNLEGKILLETTINSDSGKIDCRILENGVYIIRLENNNSLKIHKLIIAR